MRWIIILVLISAISLNASSQRFNGGIVAGGDVSQVDGDEMAGYHKGGLIFGGFINTNLNEKLKAQFEIIYIAKGSKQTPDSANPQREYRRISLNYIEVPVVIQWWYQKLRLYVEGGLGFGVLIADKEEDANGELNGYMVGPYKKFELSGLVGLNFAITDQLMIGMRGSYSILPIANEQLITTWKRYGGTYNNVIELTLKYQFIKPE